MCEGVLEKSYFLEVGKITLFAEALVSALACGALAMCVMWVEYLKNVRWVKYKKDKIENRLSSPINISFLVFSQWSILVLSSVFCFFTLGGNVPALWTVRAGESSCCRLFPVYVVIALLNYTT